MTEKSNREIRSSLGQSCLWTFFSTKYCSFGISASRYTVCACACVSTRAQSCPTLCNPKDCSPPGSSIHEIFFRQEYQSGLPFPPPEDLPDPGFKPASPRHTLSLHKNCSPNWLFAYFCNSSHLCPISTIVYLILFWNKFIFSINWFLKEIFRVGKPVSCIINGTKP